MFIGLLSFGVTLATKCMSFNKVPCMNRPTLIKLNPVKFNYDPFMIILDNCNGSWDNAVDGLSTKLCFQRKYLMWLQE